MRIIPVIDLQHGLVVRGVGGRRTEYRPIVSKIAATSEPATIAHAFAERFGLKEIYIADLDAIAGHAPAHDVFDQLHALGCRLWVDAGIRTVEDARRLSQEAVEMTVVGLETIHAPEDLRTICHKLDGDRIAFSLDMRQGQPLGCTQIWGADVIQIVAHAAAAGVRNIIVLDLARVGVNSGPGTDDLCRQIVTSYPGMRVIAGGGVRDLGDLIRLKQSGVSAALVASAFHDERLTAVDLASLNP